MTSTRSSDVNNYKKPSSSSSTSSSNPLLLPILALLCSQLFTSSWHVLGKHVMHQVPYLAPISYVLIRTFISSLALLIVGILTEGYVPFPSLFLRAGAEQQSKSSLVKVKPLSSKTDDDDDDSSIGIGLPISQSNSTNSLNTNIGIGIGMIDDDKKVEDYPTQSPVPKHHHHHHDRSRRRKRRSTSTTSSRTIFKHYVPSICTILYNTHTTLKYYQQQITNNNLNPETIQIIFAGLSGMLLLPTCYTTGLILTSPTVASVWDGPMIPLGCFCAAVTLGLERRSTIHPIGQIGSLLLTVCGSIVVLLVDYMGGGHGMNQHHIIKAVVPSDINSAAEAHVQFIRGNMVLAGIVAAYSATALLQKRLNHYPPLQLTGWMFGIANIGCFTLLLVDGILGGVLTGCSLGQALIQLYAALTTSPTFRYGLLYSALFVGGACFSIASYASSHLESSVITLFAATQPPITAVLEWIWEGKGLGWKKVFGMVCVGLGMHFFTYIKKIEKKHYQPRRRHEKKSQSAYEERGQVKVINGVSSKSLPNRKSVADV